MEFCVAIFQFSIDNHDIEGRITKHTYKYNNEYSVYLLDIYLEQTKKIKKHKHRIYHE